MNKKIILVYSLLILCQPAFSKSLSVEDFSSLPDVSRVSLSPSGTKLSSVIRLNTENKKGSIVQVTDLKSNEKKIMLFTDNSKYFLNWVRWKDDRTLLVGTYYPSERDTWTGMSQARYKTRELRMLIIDTETGQISSPFKTNFLKKYKILPSGMSEVTDNLENDPDNILMTFPSLDIGWSGYPAVFKVNIKNQQNQIVQQAKINVVAWMTDQQQRVRVGYFQKDKINKTLVLDLDSNKWLELWAYENFSDQEITAIGFGANPNELYLRAYHEKRLAIFKVNLKDPDLKKELVYEDPRYDVTGNLVYSPTTKEVIGLSGQEDGGTIFFETKMQILQIQINKALPKSKNYIYSLSNDLQKYLVYSSSDVDSGTYWIGQRSPAKLDPVAYRYKNLLPDAMAATKRITYKSRDGMEIEAYLTIPKTGPQKNLPTLMFPHGGPMARDNDSFDYWTQFFVNKGYAVLQMNFRGSDGLGVSLRNAGLKNWGLEMQDDIEDGARKLVADGTADPKQICIVGASYGGYAALMGVVKTPDFYKCAISVAGVSNVYDLVKDHRAFWRAYNVVDEQIGNDNSHLKEISPVNHAKEIKAPILLIHGDSDRQVEIKHSEQMRDALQKEGKNFTYISLPNEDHYLSNETNRVKAFRAMDEFLDKYLPITH